MKLKILVFDPEASLRELLQVYLTGQGHEVLAFRDPTVCPVYRNFREETCRCDQSAPCADVILADIRLPQLDGLEFLRRQNERGCRSVAANRALMSAAMTAAEERAVTALGCHFIRKPFHLGEIGRWVRECAARAAAARAAATD